VNHRPQKTKPNHTRLTVGGNLIDYPGDVSTPTADTTTAKLVINSTLFTPNAKYMCGDINNFYLGAPMERKENMRLPLAIIPREIIDEYKLALLEHKGHTSTLKYVEACMGSHRLEYSPINY
jgi:hypothetical protein